MISAAGALCELVALGFLAATMPNAPPEESYWLSR
jgi:hypothetical protein